MERRRLLVTLEILAAFVVSALFVWSCRRVDVDANDRMGQVSAIAAVEWRFVIVALVVFVGLAIAARGPRFELASRFACAAIAGLASATVAGGVVIMLHRTRFGLGAVGGDAGILIDWAEQAKAGKGMGSSVYPPLQIYLLAAMSKLSGIRCAYLLQLFQVVGVAAMGPAGYAAWRLVLKSKAALAISVISVLPMIECYRQYPLLVLVITIPVLVKFLQVLRDAAELNLGQTLRYAALFGVSLGLLFLLYSGWYQWSGPGFIVAAALVFPWRTGWRQGAILCGVSALLFGLLAYNYVTGVVTGTGVKDDYMYFDATIEPMFVAMWRGGLPGAVTLWPPIGELGGVGLFTLVLAAGLAIAVAYGRKHEIVIGVGCILAGSWLFRLWHAHRMWKTKLVQLWPRTTAELLYLLVVLATVGVYFSIERARKRAPEDSFLRTPGGFLGLVVALVVLIGSASSATIDKYMPRDIEADYGHLSWVALHHPPVEANQLTIGSDAKASSSLETPLWSEGGAIDHKLWRGYSSKLGIKEDHTEWMVLDMKQYRKFSRVRWWPAMDGSPIQLTIEVWEGDHFTPDITIDDFPQRYTWPQQINLSRLWESDKIRIRATKLRPLADGDFVLRVAEIELYE